MRRKDRNGYGAGDGGHCGMRLRLIDRSANFQGKAAMGITRPNVCQVVGGR
jgi:hypothetical protein